MADKDPTLNTIPTDPAKFKEYVEKLQAEKDALAKEVSGKDTAYARVKQERDTARQETDTVLGKVDEFKADMLSRPDVYIEQLQLQQKQAGTAPVAPIVPDEGEEIPGWGKELTTQLQESQKANQELLKQNQVLTAKQDETAKSTFEIKEREAKTKTAQLFTEKFDGFNWRSEGQRNRALESLYNNILKGGKIDDVVKTLKEDLGETVPEPTPEEQHLVTVEEVLKNNTFAGSPLSEPGPGGEPAPPEKLTAENYDDYMEKANARATSLRNAMNSASSMGSVS